MLLAVSRGSDTFVKPNAEFVIEPGDEALVVAEMLGPSSRSELLRPNGQRSR